MKRGKSLRILVASDNHGNETSLEDLFYIYEDIDLWIHCGDSEFGANHGVWEKFKTVRGNMDFEDQFPNIRMESHMDSNFVILHGHNHRVRSTLDAMEEIAEEHSASVVFYGHTHIAKVDKQNEVYFINPGSIAQPRGELRVGSYAIYEKVNNNEHIYFYDWNHNELTELSQKLV